MQLLKGQMSVANYEAKFAEISRYALQVIGIEREKARKFHEGHAQQINQAIRRASRVTTAILVSQNHRIKRSPEPPHPSRLRSSRVSSAEKYTRENAKPTTPVDKQTIWLRIALNCNSSNRNRNRNDPTNGRAFLYIFAYRTLVACETCLLRSLGRQ